MMRLVWVLFIVAAVAALFFYGINRDPDKRDNIRSGLVGNPAPSFELTTYERFQASYGDSLGIAGQAPLTIATESSSTANTNTAQADPENITTLGTPTIINFWASWCPPCRDEAPLLEEMWLKHQSDVLILGVNTQDANQTNANNFLDEFEWTFPNVVDAGSRIGIQYGVFGLPETFFINRDGTISFKYAGPLTAEIFEREVQKIIQ